VSERLLLELEDFSVAHRRRVTTYYRRSLLGDLGESALMDLPATVAGLPGSHSRSTRRATIWHLPGEGGRLTFVVRKYHHGGLWGRVARDLFLGSGRMLRELATYEHAWRRGVPTCQTAALRIEHVAGPLCRAYLVTVRIEGARNVEAYARSVGGGWPAPREEAKISGAIASALRKLHDSGIFHSDLNVKNILLRETLEGPEAFVIDFDRAVLMNHVSLDARMQNLVRLDRSVLKWPDLREHVGRLDRLRLARDYLRAYPEWERQWKEIVRMYVTRHAWHWVTRVRGRAPAETRPEAGGG
jgi:tRNA A-37 threonylcarbamoyl transferase component Bud32